MNRDSTNSLEQELKAPAKLNRRMNSFDETNFNEYDNLLSELHLNRHNSTFPITDLDL